MEPCPSALALAIFRTAPKPTQESCPFRKDGLWTTFESCFPASPPGIRTEHASVSGEGCKGENFLAACGKAAWGGRPDREPPRREFPLRINLNERISRWHW